MSPRRHRGSEHGGAISTLVSLLFLVAFCAVLYLARHPIYRFAAGEWVVDQPAARADVLLVLGDDNFYADRATKTVELFRQGTAPVVVASGRRLRPNAALTELMDHDLVERGIPRDAILRLTHDADSMRQEAELFRHLALEKHWKSVVIVTSNYNARRALYVYNKVLSPGISVSVAGARDAEFDPDHWWEKRISAKHFFNEIVAMFDAIWELRGDPHPAATTT